MTDDAAESTAAPARINDEAVKKASARLTKFANEHGGARHAYLEYVTANRARVVVVGQDGRWGDQVLDSYEEAQAVIAATGFEAEDEREWSREATSAVKTTAYEWGRMGRGRSASS